MFLKLISSKVTYSFMSFYIPSLFIQTYIHIEGFGLTVYYQEQTKTKKDHTIHVFKDVIVCLVINHRPASHSQWLQI